MHSSGTPSPTSLSSGSGPAPRRAARRTAARRLAAGSLAVYGEVRDATLTVTLPAGSDSPSVSATPRPFIADEPAIVAAHYGTQLTSTSSPAVPTPTRVVIADGTVTCTYDFPYIPAESRMMLSFQGHGYVNGTQQFASALLYGTRVNPKIDYSPGLGTEEDPYLYELRDLIPGETVSARVPNPLRNRPPNRRRSPHRPRLRHPRSSRRRSPSSRSQGPRRARAPRSRATAQTARAQTPAPRQSRPRPHRSRPHRSRPLLRRRPSSPPLSSGGASSCRTPVSRTDRW
ncbi:hypothetical protein Kosp01_11080 [Kocuria sp. NBRC 114282]|nr:hypothetical protein Kosp01_11080 [Kocuria sp. NBRC 114282]